MDVHTAQERVYGAAEEREQKRLAEAEAINAFGEAVDSIPTFTMINEGGDIKGFVVKSGYFLASRFVATVVVNQNKYEMEFKTDLGDRLINGEVQAYQDALTYANHVAENDNESVWDDLPASAQ